MSENTNTFDPMAAVVSDGGQVPPGTYTGKFMRADYLPTCEPDPMTGKGGRQYDAIRFSWEVADGEYGGKVVSVDTPKATGTKSRFYCVGCWLLGRNPAAGERMNLNPCVGQKYLLTVGSKPGKSWMEVVNAMKLPNQ
jgi:hypothetical protein